MTTIVSTEHVLIADSLHFLETISGWETTMTAQKINFLECDRAAYAMSGTNQFPPAALEVLQRELRLIVGKLNTNKTLTGSDLRDEFKEFISSADEFEIILVTKNRGRWLISLSSGITYVPPKALVALGSGASRVQMCAHLLGERSLEELLTYVARHEELTRGPWTRLKLSNLKEFDDVIIE